MAGEVRALGGLARGAAGHRRGVQQPDAVTTRRRAERHDVQQTGAPLCSWRAAVGGPLGQPRVRRTVTAATVLIALPPPTRAVRTVIVPFSDRRPAARRAARVTRTTTRCERPALKRKRCVPSRTSLRPAAGRTSMRSVPLHVALVHVSRGRTVSSARMRRIWRAAGLARPCATVGITSGAWATTVGPATAVGDSDAARIRWTSPLTLVQVSAARPAPSIATSGTSIAPPVPRASVSALENGPASPAIATCATGSR